MVIFIKNKILNTYKYIKNYLLCSQNRKKNLTTIGFIIVLILFLLITVSNAFYNNELEMSLIHAVVGDPRSNKYDFILKIYLENDNNSETKTYRLSNNIPEYNYEYNRYYCKNNSSLEYDDINKVTRVFINEKEECAIYFDLINKADIIVNINVENGINTNNYILATDIPYYGYTYNNYSCSNNSTITYNSNLHNISINSNSKDICNLYFRKTKENIDIDLYIEDVLNSNTYTKKESIPNNINYSINNLKSNCVDINNDTINVTFSYINGYIDISGKDIDKCEVYMDVANE